MRQRLCLHAILLLAGAALLLAAGCGGDGDGSASDQPPQGLAAGRVEGSEAFIAFVAKDGELAAYVCDSDTIAEWFRGPIEGNTVELQSEGGASLTAELSADGVTGTFTPSGGEPLAFTASPAGEGAGLYRAEGTVEGEELLAGWIVLPDGEQRGSLKRGGSVQAAPTLNPSNLTATSITVPISRWTDPDPTPWSDPDPSP
jgi:hypothetical protein